MKLINLIRAMEWWEYKFPPILVGAYLFLSEAPSFSLQVSISLFLFMLLSLITGAVYVSILNDMTDVADDSSAGKQNRVAGYGIAARFFLILIPLLAAALCCWPMRDSPLTLFFYISSYLCFTLYSVPPFRLKKRGLAGIFADAAGSQLFPTLYAAALLSSWLDIELPLYALLLLGVWSFCLGLRGILWHQFHDLENDIRSGMYTWVRKLSGKNIRALGIAVLSVEIFALLLLLIAFNQYLCLACLAVYALYLWLRHRRTAVEIITIKYTSPNYCILMNEYYQVFLPIAILASISADHPQALYLLLIHIAIFPTGLYKVCRNIFPVRPHSQS